MISRDNTKKKGESLLIFVPSSNDAGKTKAEAGVSIVAINADDKKGSFLFRKWLIVHEISHLFGTDDVIDKNNIMDEDALRSVTQESDSLMAFDDNNKAIIEIAKSYMIKNNLSAFSLLNCDLETGEKVIQCMKSNVNIMRKPEGLSSSFGEFYLVQKQFEKALSYLNQSIAMIREDDEDGFKNIALDLVLYNKALCLFNLKRYEEAIEAFQESLAEGPPTPYNKHFWLGIAFKLSHDQKNDWTKEYIEFAIETFKKGAGYFPGYDWGWFCLASMELYLIPIDEWNSDAVEQVKTHLEKCLEINPNHASGLFLMGAILQHQNKPKKAETFLSKAKEAGAALNMVFLKNGGSFSAK